MFGKLKKLFQCKTKEQETIKGHEVKSLNELNTSDMIDFSHDYQLPEDISGKSYRVSSVNTEHHESAYVLVISIVSLEDINIEYELFFHDDKVIICKAVNLSEWFDIETYTVTNDQHEFTGEQYEALYVDSHVICHNIDIRFNEITEDGYENCGTLLESNCENKYIRIIGDSDSKTEYLGYVLEDQHINKVYGL